MSLLNENLIESYKDWAEENNVIITGEWDGEPIWREKYTDDEWENRATRDRVIRKEIEKASEKIESIESRNYNPYNSKYGNDPYYTARE